MTENNININDLIRILQDLPEDAKNRNILGITGCLDGSSRDKLVPGFQFELMDDEDFKNRKYVLVPQNKNDYMNDSFGKRQYLPEKKEAQNQFKTNDSFSERFGVHRGYSAPGYIGIVTNILSLPDKTFFYVSNSGYRGYIDTDEKTGQRILYSGTNMKMRNPMKGYLNKHYFDKGGILDAVLRDVYTVSENGEKQYIDLTAKEIEMETINDFAKWCYIHGIDFSYMGSNAREFCEKVIERYVKENNLYQFPSQRTIYEIVQNFDDTKKDELYRMLWAEHVYEDVMAVLNENDIIPEEDKAAIAKAVTNAYVYQGRYDCNVAYWDNINRLITEYCPREKENTAEEMERD